jgi:hypothetical protein
VLFVCGNENGARRRSAFLFFCGTKKIAGRGSTAFFYLSAAGGGWTILLTSATDGRSRAVALAAYY